MVQLPCNSTVRGESCDPPLVSHGETSARQFDITPVALTVVALAFFVVIMAKCAKWFVSGLKLQELEINNIQTPDDEANFLTTTTIRSDQMVEMNSRPTQQLKVVKEKLTKLKLMGYVDKFAEYGYDDWDEILRMGEGNTTDFCPPPTLYCYFRFPLLLF